MARAGAPRRPRPRLTYKGGRPLDGLPWPDPPRARYLQAAQPAGPEGITVAFAPTPAGTQLTATAHPEVVVLAALRAALAEVAAAGGGGPQGEGSSVASGAPSETAVSERR